MYNAFLDLAREWRNRTSHQAVNCPVIGFEARSTHQSCTLSKVVIIAKKTYILLLCLYFCGCSNAFSTIMMSKNVYDIYGLSVDERHLYDIVKDRAIITKIQLFIANQKITKLLRIGVESFYGHVYLIGQYEHEESKNSIINYVKNLQGVRAVSTYLLPKNRSSCSSANDLRLVASVKSALLANKTIWGSDIHVHSVQCQVVLVGIVGQRLQKDLAISEVKKIRGVKKIISFIRAID